MHRRIRLGVLTSSRADYGIYYPLLSLIQKDNQFDLSLLVFGTHLSPRFGMTVEEIRKDGFKIAFEARTEPEGDSPADIAMAMSVVIREFSGLWANGDYDLVIALGDRYEMFAAVSSTLPYNLRVAHIHGGETTRGAIDNAFRHSITHMSEIHFAACEAYAKRIREITGEEGAKVYNTGSLSYDNMKMMDYYTAKEIKEAYDIDMSVPCILVTFHPETAAYEDNRKNVDKLIEALKMRGDYKLLITMPNSDTGNTYIRESFNTLAEEDSGVKCVENLGSKGYLSCMKLCSFILGNSSSGFIEASYFPKSVINIGSRQDGRIRTPNIIDCKIDRDEIIRSISLAEKALVTDRPMIYGDGNAAGKMISVIKEIFSNTLS